MFRQKNSTATIFSGALASESLPALPPGEEIYDIRPPIGLPYPWAELALKAFLLILFLFLLYRIWNWLTAEPRRQPRVISQSPEKMALRAIKRLQLSPVWHERQMKEICETLVFILKDYLKEAHDVGLGAAATSDEMLSSLQSCKPPHGFVKKAAELFEICDRIKFTGQNYEADADKLVSKVKELVQNKGWAQ